MVYSSGHTIRHNFIVSFSRKFMLCSQTALFLSNEPQDREDTLLVSLMSLTR